MRPIAIITGIILGSSVAITLSLAVVLLIYLLIGTDEPAMRREIPALGLNTAMFLGLTAVAASAFYGALAAKQWRWIALVALIATLAGFTGYYWP
jgi:hypothetical protein